MDYWRNRYDWRKHEALLNAFANFRAVVDGQPIHFIHEQGKGPSPLPLILLHGWPGSVYEMYKIIRPLADPAAYGGDPADAFAVVVPSLPGYGFSGPTRERGIGVARMAAMFAKLMTEVLGYKRFAAHGGDWGAVIAAALGAEHAPSCLGIHVTLVLAGPPPEGALSEEEREALASLKAFFDEEAGYMRLQGTKPQTLAYALNDSPVGLAAWILEKFRTWSDCGGDVESRFTKDELLTNIMIYWATETINSSMRLYYEQRRNPWAPGPDRRVEAPTGVAVFPKEVVRPVRSWAQQSYNVCRWTSMPRGGHFAALEEPELLVEDIRAFFRSLRA